MNTAATNIREFHKQSERHVFVLEATMPVQDKCRLFHTAEQIRLAGNELTGIMKKRYEQLLRTKRYRKLKKLYGQYSEQGDTDSRNLIAQQMTDMQREYGVTWNDCRKTMIPIGKKYQIDAVFALTKAEDVWKSFERCLYAEGKKIRFASRGELPCIRAKQICRGIILKADGDVLSCRYRHTEIALSGKDRYEKDEIKAIADYLNDPETNDMNALKRYKESGEIISTYRPCYVTLVPERIRGKMRLYVHITVEGKPAGKERNRKYGQGRIGIDIGTQTIAYTSEEETGLKNLAERGTSILENERKERLLYRAMERSRRESNPGNYNEDGTVRKGKKVWRYSNRYWKLKARHTELCRRNAVNRHLSINEDVNHLRNLGDVVVTEGKNAKKLMKKAKAAKNENGVWKRRKRFGRSVKNRCPGYFQRRLKEVFEATGGKYIEVPENYRASQYDHTCDTYTKKKLSDRMYALNDGTIVQRDLYSSYLLYQYDPITQEINKEKCKSEFNRYYEKETALIETIRAEHIRILNSGIRFK